MALFEVEKPRSKLIHCYNSAALDPTKETMVLVFSRLTFSKDQDHVLGWQRQLVKEILEPRYNLVWVGVDNDASRLVEMGYTNIYVISQKRYLAVKEEQMKRAKEMNEGDDASWEYNRDVILDHFHEDLPHVSPERVMWLDERWAFLPLKDYWSKKGSPSSITERGIVNNGNEFHDCIVEDNESIDFILNTSKEVNDKYDYHVGILTFTYWMKNLLYNLGKWYIDNGVKAGKFQKSYYFVVDPGSYYRVFDGISPNHSNFAMAEDFRGTRDFQFFPIQEMQHFLFDKPWKIDKTKKRKFCFYGTIFLSKKTRKTLWDTYLRNLVREDIDIYVPPKMDGHISERRKEAMSITRFQERAREDEDIAELSESVFTHPRYQGYLDTQELNSVIATYEYALIAKNIARYDSINYRPALYVALDVFPLLDFRYDPDCKGIPQKIQEKIVVHNHEEILEKINYYDAHPVEKEAIMEELRNHFNYHNFTTEWKDMITTALEIPACAIAQ